MVSLHINVNCPHTTSERGSLSFRSLIVLPLLVFPAPPPPHHPLPSACSSPSLFAAASALFSAFTAPYCIHSFVFQLHNLFKTFAHCPLSNLEHDISAATSASSARSLDPCTVQLVLSSLRDMELTHPFKERFKAHPALLLAWASLVLPGVAKQSGALGGPVPLSLSFASSRAAVACVRYLRRSQAAQYFAGQSHVVPAACAQADALWRRMPSQVPAASRDMRCVAAPFPRVEESCAIHVR